MASLSYGLCHLLSLSLTPPLPATEQVEQPPFIRRTYGSVNTAQPSRSVNEGHLAAVLMDLGSARPARIKISDRTIAMRVQEDAERFASAPYRAPELWDVRTHSDLDERVDVWSLGCMLYTIICHESPFERALNHAGGSLALAVMSGHVEWPRDGAPVLESMRNLVSYMLVLDPACRPTIGEVRQRIRHTRQHIES